jgi:hypothetical protein
MVAEIVRRANLAGLSYADFIADVFARRGDELPPSYKAELAESERLAQQVDLPVDQYIHLEASIRAQSLVAELVQSGFQPEPWLPFPPALHLVADNDD